MRTTSLLFVLLSAAAMAESVPSPATNVVTTTVSPDGGPLSWFVDVRGSDSNTCRNEYTDGGRSGPCATPGAALAKIPRHLFHNVTVNIDAGTYPGFVVSGFTQDGTLQRKNGGILISGVRATSTLATGTSSGTATGGTAGSGPTRGTLVHTGQTWTVNDLRGRYVRIASGTGSGQVVPIAENTADTLTITRSWTAPTSGSTYVIEEPAVTINTCVGLIAAATTSTEALVAGVSVGPNIGVRSTIRDIKVSVSGCANGFEVAGTGSVSLQRTTVTSGPTGSNYRMSDLQPYPQITVSDAISQSTAAAAHLRTFDNGSKGSLALSGFLGYGTTTMGIDTGALTVSGASGISLYGVTMGISAIGHAIWAGVIANITCTNSTGIGVGAGAVFGGSFGLQSRVYGATHLVVSGLVVNTCGTGLLIAGPGAGADVKSLAGSVTATGIDVREGGYASILKSGVTLTSGTNDISIDPGSATATTSSLASLAAGACVKSDQGSRACAR